MTRSQLEQLATEAAQLHGLPVAGYLAQIGQESAWNPNAVSPVGAMGLAQFMPATWAEFGNEQNPFDPAASLDAGARYMVWIRQWLQRQGLEGSWDQVLASYNWGIGNVRTAVRIHKADWLNYAPAETQNYVRKLAPYYMPNQSPPPVLLAAIAAGALLYVSLM